MGPLEAIKWLFGLPGALLRVIGAVLSFVVNVVKIIGALIVVVIILLTAISVGLIVGDLVLSLHSVAPFMHKHAFLETVTKVGFALAGVGVAFLFLSNNENSPTWRLADRQARASGWQSENARRAEEGKPPLPGPFP